MHFIPPRPRSCCAMVARAIGWHAASGGEQLDMARRHPVAGVVGEQDVRPVGGQCRGEHVAVLGGQNHIWREHGGHRIGDRRRARRNGRPQQPAIRSAPGSTTSKTSDGHEDRRNQSTAGAAHEVTAGDPSVLDVRLV